MVWCKSALNRSEAIKIEPGAKLKELRIQAGMSQSELGEAVSVSFAQVQKYKGAEIRIAASTLVQVCKVFNVGPMVFLGPYFPSEIVSE